VSREAAAGAAPATGLLGKLMAAVRPEFRVDVLLPTADDLMLGAPPCRVPQCLRRQRTRGFCHPHYQRWYGQGRPDVDEYAATTDPRTVGRQSLTACQVPDCRFGAARRGLCISHHGFWERAGRPDRAAWIATAVVRDHNVRDCTLSYCELWAEGNSPFCTNHKSRWHAVGCPDVETFIQWCETCGDERFDFRPLNQQRQLKLELQYALQCRHDERRARARAWTVVTQVVRFAAASGVTSLLDRTAEQWDRDYQQAHSSSQANGQLAFLRFARRCVEDLQAGTGWEAEYPRDVWELRRLGMDNTRARLRFDRITQPWLREPAKRFVRWRLSAGRSVNQAIIDILAINRFSGFLADPRVSMRGMTDVDRVLLERYLADLASDPRAARSRSRDISSLGAFFQAVRRNGWDDQLPANATFYPDDYPKPDKRLPRGLADQVMAQVERPDNLDRWHQPEGRLLTLILMRCGLRVGDACHVGFDCVIRDRDGAPYLRYHNRKMKREALVPIDEEIEREITGQQRRILQRWADGSAWLFPAPRMNPDGRIPLSTSSYRGQLAMWLQRCEVRDEHDRPVHLTPHQWRHTFGTRLINHDVPQEVVRVLLDHTSGEMTAHYARLHDTTVRRHWEAARKVNAKGETVTIDPNGPLAEANWAKQRLGRATQALPNGYCGLPVQKTCPHANACLTCPMFITTAEFLPQHHHQRREVLQIISGAQARGQLRLVEMNQQILGNLDRVIATLDADRDEPGVIADAG